MTDIRIADCKHEIDTDNSTTFYEIYGNNGFEVICKKCFDIKVVK